MRSSVVIPVVTTLLLVGYIVIVLYLLVKLNTASLEEVPYLPSYEGCATQTCGNSIIRYPFGTCGRLDGYCNHDNQAALYWDGVSNSITWRVVGDITESSYHTRTLQITPSSQITIPYYNDMPDSSLTYDMADSSHSYDWLIKDGIFRLSPGYIVGTIFSCTPQAEQIKIFQDDPKTIPLQCEQSNNYCFFYPAPDVSLTNCTSYPIVVPTDKTYYMSADKYFEQLQHRGFQITWSVPDDCQSCQATDQGRCVSNSYDYDYDFLCVCSDNAVHHSNCSDGGRIRRPLRRVLPLEYTAVIFFAHCGAFITVVVSCIAFRRRCCCKRTDIEEEEQTILEFMDPLDSTPPSVENFLHYYSSLVPTRYSYTQIRAYTNNLADQLGKGGFGTVYKGKLPGGPLIAVKILDESKHSEQQFIAEVATVGRTYHVNLVRLLGYCSEGSKRALVYEFMVNGSLDKYVHGDPENQLDWELLYSIALGTARGIAYLHEECRNKILHCDIKPHNVLLDANFLPKVADFGLAKMSNREESHISIAQGGTLGYAAPEMWSRMYGPVTDRCDVYSYGMLIMEMVGGRKNLDLENKESRSSKFFYAEWAFKQVERGEFGNLRKEKMTAEEEAIAKKLSLVGLWCIQFHASRRPKMSKVVQMLEGDDDVTLPPYPFPVDTPRTMEPSSSGQQSSSFPADTTEIMECHRQSGCEQSSSSNTLEVEMIDPKSIDTAATTSG